MKTQQNFNYRITASRPVPFHLLSSIARARVTRFFLLMVFGASLLVGLANPALANDSCESEGEVTIAYKGIMCAFVPYSITLNGTVANGPGDSCIGISANTPKTFTKLKLNKTYQMTAGYAICITTINFQVPEGYALYIDGVESNQIYKSDALGHVYSGDGTWNLVVRKKCECGPNGAGEGSTKRGSVLWETGMGMLTDGRSAEHLGIREQVLSANIYTPASLVYSPPGLSNEVDVVNGGDSSLRQVKAPQALADIVVVNGSEYDVRYYRSADVGTKVNGLYEVTGQPFVTWKIKNPDPSSSSRVQFQKIENGTIVDQSEYSWEAVTDSWTLSSGWTAGSGTYARVESSWVSHPAPNLRTVTNTVRNSSGQISFKASRTYQAFAWGEELVQEIEDPEGSALTTTYEYYADLNQDWTSGQVKSITKSDGSWEKYEYNPQDWSISTVLRPWKDVTLDAATAENARATLFQYARHDGYKIYGYYKFITGIQEQVDGKIIRNKTITRWSAVNGMPITINGEPVVREEERTYASESLSQVTTTTRYYATATLSLANRIAEQEYEDGQKGTYTYERGNYTANNDPALSLFTPDSNGLAERETVTHGTITSPQGLPFKSTKETLVHDQHGNEVLKETYVYSGAGYDRVAWVASVYNNRGQLTQTTNQNGQVSSCTWEGDRKTSEIDPAGVETVYTHDSLGRVATSTKKGIAAGGGFPSQTDVVTTFSYDASGHETGKTVSGGSLTLTSSKTFDRAGRVKSNTDNAGLTTIYSYANGGLSETVTRPGGAKEITNKFRDGRLNSVTGTAVVTRSFDYGVNADGSQYTQEFTGNSGLSSPRWIKTTTDWIGRPIKRERPGFTGTNLVQNFYYNDKAKLQSQVTMAGTNKILADKLFEYDELGNQIRSGLDIDASGMLTLASTDRVNDLESIYEKTGSDWYWVTSTRTYLTDNNATPTIQTRRERLNNFPLNGTERTVSEVTVTDTAGNNTKTSAAIDRGVKKQTTTVDTPDSSISAVSISVNGLSQSLAPPTPQSAITYTYDSLGRQTAVTDPATGTTARNYSVTTGQITSTNHGANSTSFEYYPATHINAGRLKAQTNAVGKKVYFNYDNRGELIQTWGDTAYPKEYIYDGYNQRTELHTFRSGQAWNTTAWPAAATGTADVTKWTYQESTGLLTQKQDATLKGASYTFDELGRPKTRTWARGITCTYTYDPNTGEMIGVSYSDSTPGVTFAYDRGGRQKTITDAAGSRARSFNVAGELQTEQITGGILDLMQVSSSFDSLLRRQFLQASRGGTVLTSQTYTYDPTSRLETITSGSQTATYAYYPNSGLLNTTTFTGGTNMARSYDALGRLESITTTPAAGGAQSYSYTYNNLDQRTRLTREDGSYWSYIYNDRDELVSGKKYWVDNTPVWGNQTEYSFDNIGNRKVAKAGGNSLGQLRPAAYTANSLNQYAQRAVPGAVDITGTATSISTVSVNDGATTRKGDYFYKELTVDNSAVPVNAAVNVVGARNNFGAGGEDAVTEAGGSVFVPRALEAFTYDDDGNLTSDGRWNYTWDGENRLVSMEALAAVPATAKRRLEFAYDWMGRRIQKKIYNWNPQTSNYNLEAPVSFVYDGWNLMAEYIELDSITRSFIWGQDVSGTLHGAGGIGGLLFIEDSAMTYSAGYDGSGNLSSLVKGDDGSISASYEYDPFGNTLKSVGDYAFENRFRFSTKYTDAETGLSYYGYRYYQPHTGRWLSRDPIGEDGGLNLYGFVTNNPIGKTDARGLHEIDVHYYLTYFLARQTGCFSESQAQQIAFFTQEVDDDTAHTSPGPGLTAEQRFRNELYHALHPGSRQPYLDYHRNNALAYGERGNLRYVGQYLHYLQDTFSHAGFSDSILGHAVGGKHILPLHLVDKTDEDLDKTQDMARATYAELNKFAWAFCRCKGSESLNWLDRFMDFAQVPSGDAITERLYALDETKSSPGGIPRRWFDIFGPEAPFLEIKRNILGIPLKPPR